MEQQYIEQSGCMGHKRHNIAVDGEQLLHGLREHTITWDRAAMKEWLFSIWLTLAPWDPRLNS